MYVFEILEPKAIVVILPTGSRSKGPSLGSAVVWRGQGFLAEQVMVLKKEGQHYVLTMIGEVITLS